jgi:tetratricopeptide (TPR) repeat protein
MRTMLNALLLCVFALMSLPASLPAQHALPDISEIEGTFHYVPPSARQSVEIGNFYFRRKQYPGALSRYEEATKDDPYYAPAYLGLGKVYEKMGKEREAIAAYHKYLNVLPSQKQANEAKGAHRAIHRLERRLDRAHKKSPAAQPRTSAAEK